MNATDVLDALRAAVLCDPMDYVSRFALADALEECVQGGGRDARLVGECVRARSVAADLLSAGSKAWVKDVKRQCGYRRRKVTFEVGTSVDVHDTEWGGGSRNAYACYSVSRGAARLGALAGDFVEGRSCPVRIGAPTVCRSWFMGKDCGLTVTVHPADLVYFVA